MSGLRPETLTACEPIASVPTAKTNRVSHAALVTLAGQWLRKQCAVVLTELATSGEEPDAIGWQGSRSILVECKVSREDYRADAAKFFRREPDRGIGLNRYFLSLPGIIAPETLPANWGLLEVTGTKIRKVRPSGEHEANSRHEIAILLSTLRRIGASAPKGISIRCYTIETLSRATLSVACPSDVTNTSGNSVRANAESGSSVKTLGLSPKEGE